MLCANAERGLMILHCEGWASRNLRVSHGRTLVVTSVLLAVHVSQFTMFNPILIIKVSKLIIFALINKEKVSVIILSQDHIIFMSLNLQLPRCDVQVWQVHASFCRELVVFKLLNISHVGCLVWGTCTCADVVHLDTVLGVPDI